MLFFYIFFAKITEKSNFLNFYKERIFMTIVEFYDKTAVENMASTLLCSPDKVIFVGDNEKRMVRSIENYKKLAEDRGIDVEFIPQKLSRNNLQNCINVLSNIVETNEDCIFDIEGGDEIYHIALGVIFEKYGNRIQIHRFNIHTNALTDCDADGKVCATSPVELSIDENIRLYGGRIITSDEVEGGMYNWNFNDDFAKDIELMWMLCTKNTGRWNGQIGCISKLCAESRLNSELEFDASMEIVTTIMKKNNAYVNQFLLLLRDLEIYGLIRNLFYNDNVVSFVFKNEQVKRCLTVAGRLLEVFAALNATRATDKKGNILYNDVRTGVYIDWDCVVAPEFTTDVANEIDVIVMKGLTPVFISCKNGHFDVDELYKLSVVAERFGGKYARKVIIASESLEDSTKGKYLKARGKDMGIRFIDDIDKMPQSQIDKEFRSLWLAP